MAYIGIDATSLPLEPVGAGNYMIHLIRAYTGMNFPHKLVIFIQRSGARLLGIPEKEQIEFVVLPDRKPGSRLIWEQVILPRLADLKGLDLLHSLHYTRPVVLSCASIVTFHDMTFFLYPHMHTWVKRVLFPPIISWGARHSQAILTVSESTRQDTIRLLRVPPKKIYTTPLGVDESFHRILDRDCLEAVRAKYQLPVPFILFVGTVEPRKNLPLLLQAYASMTRKGDPHNLVIVGKLGWNYEEVFRTIEKFGISKKVFLTGYLPLEDLPAIFNLADLFVYPSYYEGFGLPVLESMACGTPVITTSISSMPEFVGNAGILIPPGDVGALESALSDVLNDLGKLERFSREGIERASHYTWERMAEKTMQTYESVL